jgi:ribosomal protein S25
MSVKGIYMEEDKKEEIKIVKVTEELIKAKTYEVRGYKVMLDFDLAKIYGYSTKLLINRSKITVSVSHQILHLNLPRKRLTT